MRLKAISRRIGGW